MNPTTFVAALLGAALLSAACAAVETPPPASGPPPFRGVKTVALVRRVVDPRAPRGPDPLDALKESLVARGYEVRVVDLPGTGTELRDLDQLQERIESRAWTRSGPDGGVERAGADAGAIVARLGVDAVIGYHRFDPRLAPLTPPPPTQWSGPSPFPAQPQPAARTPSGALSLLGADGALAWFPWGAGGADPGALLNAAEAIDALLATLAGEAGDDG